jgi:hypothetical protein
MDDDTQDQAPTQEPVPVTGTGGLTIHKPGVGSDKDDDE